MKFKKLKNNIKNIFHSLTGKDYRYKLGVKKYSQWYGNNDGGFFIHPDIINSDSVVYSIGIGEDISFDKKMNENHNCKIFMFDPTPRSINWIKSKHLNENFIFHPFGIDKVTSEVDFYLPNNELFVSGSILLHSNVNKARSIKVQMKSFNDIILTLAHSKIDVLKMDIEGYEYEILTSILESSISIRQILIEFHSRFFKNGKEKTRFAVKLLKSYGYEIFAISDSYEEISFIKVR